MFVDLTLHLPPDHPSRSSLSKRDAALASSGHFGTHLDRHGNSVIPLSYIKSRCRLVDISALNGEISPQVLDGLDPRPGDSLLFRTGALERYGYGTPEYNDAGPLFAWETLDRFTGAKLGFIGLDIRGLRKGDEHNKADRVCEAGGVYIIENLDNFSRLPEKTPFTLYAMWFEREGSGLPCRVVAEL